MLFKFLADADFVW